MSVLCRVCLKARNTQIWDLRFVTKTLKKTWVNFLFFKFFWHSLEKISLEVRNFNKSFFQGNALLIRLHFNHVFNYTQMKMAHLSLTSQHMSSIGEACDRLGKIILTSLVNNHWANGWLRVNSSSVRGWLIIFPLFLIKGNAILPMTPRADCELRQNLNGNET